MQSMWKGRIPVRGGSSFYSHDGLPWALGDPQYVKSGLGWGAQAHAPLPFRAPAPDGQFPEDDQWTKHDAPHELDPTPMAIHASGRRSQFYLPDDGLYNFKRVDGTSERFWGSDLVNPYQAQPRVQAEFHRWAQEQDQRKEEFDPGPTVRGITVPGLSVLARSSPHFSRLDEYPTAPASVAASREAWWSATQQTGRTASDWSRWITWGSGRCSGARWDGAPTTPSQARSAVSGQVLY